MSDALCVCVRLANTHEYPHKYVCVCVPMRKYRQNEKHRCVPVTVTIYVCVHWYHWFGQKPAAFKPCITRTKSQSSAMRDVPKPVIYTSLDGGDEHPQVPKYQICSFVCPKMGSSILSSVPAWFFSSFSLSNGMCSTGFSEGPRKKKKKH